MDKRQKISKIFLRVILSLALFLGSVFTCFLFGAAIGAYGFDWFCLPNGCGYEATGTIGFFVGIPVGILLLIIMNKTKLFA